MQLFSFLTGAKPPLITQSLRGLADMLDTAGVMFAAATAVLLDNEALELDLSALDAQINARVQLDVVGDPIGDAHVEGDDPICAVLGAAFGEDLGV